MDDEPIRRPFLITLAAFIWSLIGILIVILSVGSLVVLTYLTASLNAGGALCFTLVTGTINIPIGLVCMYLAGRLRAGVYPDVLGVGLASLALGLVLETIGLYAIARNLPYPGKMFAATYLALIMIVFGNWFLLAGVFAIISRNRYRLWAKWKSFEPYRDPSETSATGD